MYRVPWNVIHTPWYCVMYHVVGAIILNSKKQGIKAEFRFVLWYLFVNLSLSCENVKISSSPAAHLIFLHFHTQEPNTQTRIIRLTTFCYNIPHWLIGIGVKRVYTHFVIELSTLHERAQRFLVNPKFVVSEFLRSFLICKPFGKCVT